MHTKEQLEKDVEFLVNRSMSAGSCSFGGYREVGISSNHIVAVAYGVEEIDPYKLPRDRSDLQACENMWLKLPDHRKTVDAVRAMEAARVHIYQKYPGLTPLM